MIESAGNDLIRRLVGLRGTQMMAPEPENRDLGVGSDERSKPEHFCSKFAAFRSCALFGSRLLMSDAKGHQKTLNAGTPKLL